MTKISWAGFELQNLGATSTDEDHKYNYMDNTAASSCFLWIFPFKSQFDQTLVSQTVKSLGGSNSCFSFKWLSVFREPDGPLVQFKNKKLFNATKGRFLKG